MATRIASSADRADLLDTQGPCTAPLDAAAEYLRRRIDVVLPLYVLAMFPHAIVVVLLIGAITGERRADIDLYCTYLVAAMLWRWIGLAILQRQVQQDLQMIAGAPRLWTRIGPILLVRIFSVLAITWGVFLAAIPLFYGLFIGSFATPLLLENNQPALRSVRDAISWINPGAKRLTRIIVVMLVVACVLLLAVFISERLLAVTVLPSFLGIDTAGLLVTMNSWYWDLSNFYFIFLVLDVFWTVASVILYYDSQSRRMASDLRARLVLVIEAPR